MEKKNLDNFLNLYKDFRENCIRVAKSISKMEWNYDYEDAAECENFSINDDGRVFGIGWDTYAVDNELSCYFPIEFLLMTDEELEQLVIKEKIKHDEEIRQEVKDLEEQIRKDELAELKRLQEKYGK